MQSSLFKFMKRRERESSAGKVRARSNVDCPHVPISLAVMLEFIEIFLQATTHVHPLLFCFCFCVSEEAVGSGGRV